MTRLIDKKPIYLELYEALGYFYGRQQLAVRAITDQGVSIKEFSKGVGAWRDKSPQTGHWGKDWDFFFHGGGCKITNAKTGEPIDFNGTDSQEIDIFSFINHLEWRLAREDGLPLLRAYVRDKELLAVRYLVDDLTADGILSPDHRLALEFALAK